MVPASLPEESSVQEARKTQLRCGLRLKPKRIKKERAALETKIEKTRYIPDISIQANYLTAPNISFLPQNLGAVGVLLTWQPWDWGQKRHNIAQKVDAEKQAQLSIDNVRDQVVLEVDSTFRRLRAARELLTAAQAARDAEAETLSQRDGRLFAPDSCVERSLTTAVFGRERGRSVSTRSPCVLESRADFQRALGEE